MGSVAYNPGSTLGPSQLSPSPTSEVEEYGDDAPSRSKRKVNGDHYPQVQAEVAATGNTETEKERSKVAHRNIERRYRNSGNEAAKDAGATALSIGAEIGFTGKDLGAKHDGKFVKTVGIRALVTVAEEANRQRRIAEALLKEHGLESKYRELLREESSGES